MSEILIRREYKLIIPEYINDSKISSKIEDATNKKIKRKLGLQESYSIHLSDIFDNHYATIEISKNKESNITTISQELKGKIIYGKEEFDENPEAIINIIAEFEGLITIQTFSNNSEYEDYSCHTTYEKNTPEYKRISFCVGKTKNISQAMELYQFLKENKEEIVDIFN